MGDHRAGVKLEFRMHGHEATTDMWINWSPDPDGIDRRITEWFEAQAEKAMANYRDSEWKRENAERSDEERRERTELMRLKEKYEP